MRGKADSTFLTTEKIRDHPRLCGEKFSPVLVRAIPDRITPAYAGKSAAVRYYAVATQDHPRLCGEKLFGGWDASIRAGSPPPMRGKGEDSSGSYFGTGITPAYAGKSLCCRVHA